MDREENQTQTISERIDPYPPDQHTIDRVLGGAHHDPHSVLGAHPHPDGMVVRVLRPHADEVHVVREGGEGHPLVRVHDSGLFSGVVPGPPADYRLAVRYGERVDIVDDPYRWLPTLGEIDLHLIGEGRHERLWDVLGAHVRRYDTPAGPVTGTSFAVWAPTAQGVRVTGDFDGWSGWAHPMRVLGGSGVWELFIPGVEPGTRYKFRVLGRDGRWRDKADPMAFRTEVPPATASIVDASDHQWGDEEWMAARALRQAHAEPMSVYEMHLGSWRQGLGYRELAHELVEYLGETGFTHVELLPVAEHPFGGSWGYQVTSFYSPTARFGTPDDFRYFVDHLHRHGYGVIIDWVPAHFPRDEWALARFDGSPLYEHADPRRGEQPDWGTLVFDFGRREVRNFLVANALYWLDEFHVDGLRVDAVASMLYLDYSRPEGQWLPNVHGGRENLDAVALLQEMNATVYRNHPGVVTIAEESTAWPGVTRPTHLGGLGFGFKWNMGWMHDTLDYAGRDPIYRGYHHNQMTFSLMYAFSENFVLPLSHDEVVHGKGSLWARMPGDAWNKSANLRALLAYMWAHPGKQLLFQGGEFGQEREWSESRSLDWHLLEDPLHAGVKTLVGDLNRTYRAHPALWTKDATPEGFSWIDANDAGGNVLSFLRHGVDADGKPTVLACIANFSGSPKRDYRVGLPFAGRWREVLNTDAQIYGGSGVGNLGAVEAEQTMWHGRPASAVLQLPPAGVLWLVPEPFSGAVRRRAATATDGAEATAGSAAGAIATSGTAAVTSATADEPDLAAEVPASDTPELPSSAATAPLPVVELDTATDGGPAGGAPEGGAPEGGGPAEPEAAEPDAAEPEPAVAEPAVAVAEPELDEPAVAVLDVAEPEVEEPATAIAEVADPEVTDPAVAESATAIGEVAAPPAAADPGATIAEVAEPEAAEPEVQEPEVQEPAAALPDAAEPAVAVAEVAEPPTVHPADSAPGLPSTSAGPDAASGPEIAPTEPVPASELARTSAAVPDPPAPGMDSVLDDGPGAPVADDAPVQAPPQPAGAVIDVEAAEPAVQTADDAPASAVSGVDSGVDDRTGDDRTVDDTSRTQ